jgi:2-polyprenyl-3-methyl-5-hydroxy-6-metoxy-1,4-benzoquinol methylase
MGVNQRVEVIGHVSDRTVRSITGASAAGAVIGQHGRNRGELLSKASEGFVVPSPPRRLQEPRWGPPASIAMIWNGTHRRIGDQRCVIPRPARTTSFRPRVARGAMVTIGPSRDKWAEWILERRHGGDPDVLRQTLAALAPIRDRILANATVEPGQTVLDVGCGDGLIGFAAAEAVGPCGTVIFSDISPDLLDRCRDVATQRGVLDRCQFVQAQASRLEGVDENAVDAVVLRSVLIYEADKAAAFSEFLRVLRPGGHLSLFEPINRHSTFLGNLDPGPVADLMARVMKIFETISRPTPIRCATSMSEISWY